MLPVWHAKSNVFCSSSLEKLKLKASLHVLSTQLSQLHLCQAASSAVKVWTWFLSVTQLQYFLWPAQVCTPVAGGRCAGSSLMRRTIPPDYVPHVRVHSSGKKLPLSTKDTHVLYPPFRPLLESPLQCVLSHRKNKRQKQPKISSRLLQNEDQLPAA